MAESAYEFLGSHELLTLATASNDGKPHATPIFYVSDQATVHFSLAEGSTSARNVADNPRASIGIGDAPDPGQTWDDAKGVQIDGTVVKLQGDEAKAAADKFRSRYPHLGDAVSAGPFYRLDPQDVRYVHNDVPTDEDFEALGAHWYREKVQ